MSNSTPGGIFIELTASIVSAYVSNNSVSASDLAALISQVHGALTRIVRAQSEAASEARKPAVAVKRTMTPEHPACLEDGKKFKALKGRWRTRCKLTRA